jgi:hypothetical protein
MKVRGTNPAKDPRFTREKSAQNSQETKTQVATRRHDGRAEKRKGLDEKKRGMNDGENAQDAFFPM